MMEDYSGKYLEYGEKEEAILVCPVCSECHKFLTQGKVVFVKNGLGDIDHIDWKDWKCKTHGHCQPEWFWKGDFV